MENSTREPITIQTRVHAPVGKVWEYWTTPSHITHWNSAADNWHTPAASNDLRVGGRFLYRMEARDGSFGFDFGGIYNEVAVNQLIRFTMDDDRAVTVHFESEESDTVVKEVFEPEGVNPIEMQRGGWQAILDNFKRYVEGH